MLERVAAIARCHLPLGVLSLVAGAAHAEPSASERSEPAGRAPMAAEALFEDAKKQLAAGDWQGACARFDKSLALDPSVSTQVKVAQCREREGKLATAWYDYQRALKMVAELEPGPRRDELFAYARTELQRLEPRLPRLRIRVEPREEAQRVTCDGEPVALDALGEPLPVDPGEHEIVAESAQRGHRRLLVLAREGKIADAALRFDDPAPRIEPVESFSVRDAPREWDKPEPSTASTRTESGQRRVGWIATGAGSAALAVSGYFAWSAWSQVADSSAHCDVADVCDPEGVRLRNGATSARNLSVIVGGVGVVALGVGITLLVTAPDPEATSFASVSLTASGEHVGLVASGAL